MAKLKDAIAKVKKLDLSTPSGRKKAFALLDPFDMEIGSREEYGALGHVYLVAGGPDFIHGAGGMRVGFEGKDIFIYEAKDAEKHSDLLGRYANFLKSQL